jgi:hypothetical protein
LGRESPGVVENAADECGLLHEPGRPVEEADHGDRGGASPGVDGVADLPGALPVVGERSRRLVLRTEHLTEGGDVLLPLRPGRLHEHRGRDLGELVVERVVPDGGRDDEVWLQCGDGLQVRALDGADLLGVLDCVAEVGREALEVSVAADPAHERALEQHHRLDQAVVQGDDSSRSRRDHGGALVVGDGARVGGAGDRLGGSRLLSG